MVFGVSRADDVISSGSPLKQMPLGDALLSVGLDWRERFEAVTQPLLGLKRGGNADSYLMSRLMIDAGVEDGDWRAFVQTISASVQGREGGTLPTDLDRLDMQQAFLEWNHASPVGHMRVRLGRQEMVFDDGLFISLRDGPNIRRSWQGLRVTDKTEQVTFNAFVVEPVAPAPGLFDDAGSHGESLSGAHASIEAGSGSARFDTFYYHTLQPRVVLAAGAAREQLDTLGGRVRAAFLQGGDATLGLYGQQGRFGSKPATAFAVQAGGGWTFDEMARTRIFGRVDVLSGGDPKSGRIHTFNALYPNFSYSTEAAIEAPSNLIEGALGAAAHPNEDVTVQYVCEGLWRYSAKDAFYASPGIPLNNPGPTRSRYVGVEQQLSIAVNASHNVTLAAALVNLSPSAAERSVSARSEQFGMLSFLARF